MRSWRVRVGLCLGLALASSSEVAHACAQLTVDTSVFGNSTDLATFRTAVLPYSNTEGCYSREYSGDWKTLSTAKVLGNWAPTGFKTVKVAEEKQKLQYNTNFGAGSYYGGANYLAITGLRDEVAWTKDSTANSKD